MVPRFRSELLQQLRDSGSDITKPHGFDFYLYVPTEAAAHQAAAKARESGFSTEVRPGACDSGWLCLASVTVVPKTAALDDIGSFFTQIAAALNGDFDGWEADVKTE